LPRPTPRGSQLDTYEAAIAALLARHPEITARRIYDELRLMGYTGGYTILSERVRQLRPRPVVAPVRRFETAPGLQSQMDYATYDGDEPVYNTRFLAFAAHYGFRPVACRPRRPQTKGKVERPFFYIETNLLNGRSFHGLEHLNETTVWWLAEVADVRIHRQTKARPLDRHAEERPHLLPLPAHPFDTSEVVYRTVDAEGYVVYRQNFYSVPWRLIGQTVAVRVTQDELTIYDRSFVSAACHRLFPRSVTSQRSRRLDHEPPRDSQRRLEQLGARYAELGSAGVRFLEGLLAGARYGKNQAERVLSLVATYPRADVLAALERAVQYGAFSLQALERILVVRSQPKTPLETLAEDQRRHLPPWLEEAPVSPRPTSDYQALLSEGARDAEATDLGDQAESPPRQRCDETNDSPPPP
jgi:hypothetical protein